MLLKSIQVAYGAATYVPGLLWLRDQFYTLGEPGTVSARYCYSVWLRHLVMVGKAGLDTDPKHVVELGPGNSVGMGLAALLSGAERYRALDVVNYARHDRNLRVFDELVALFQRREPIPDQTEFPAVKPYLSSYKFPSAILTERRLAAALHPDRLAKLRRELCALKTGTSSMLGYVVPWDASAVCEQERGRADMIVSQAALEHVMELKSAYQRLASLLKPAGVMSNQIDYKRHGTAFAWNGHWTYSDAQWKWVLGRRHYFINRAPHSQHIQLMRATGFVPVLERRVDRTGGVSRRQLAPRFRHMPDDDLRCSGAYILAVKD